mmetsp:Transcript_31985/g.45473  ORF Transcript_31985/g.45473 Transcript_31985/m.45473 type:complete len:218 (-) Transcript_31985:130-783(-)
MIRGLFLFSLLLSGIQLHAAFQNVPVPISLKAAQLKSPLFSPSRKLAESSDNPSEDNVPPVEPTKKRKNWFSFGQKSDDGSTFRQKLGKLGLMTVLSYGWVSNMSYGICISCAWYIFSKQSGLSPLAPDQWKKFLAVYAGFFVFNNVIRPFRVALSVGVSPVFENMVNTIHNKTKVSRGVAIGVVVFLANVVGTLALMCLGISLASLAAGVAIFPAK